MALIKRNIHIKAVVLLLILPPLMYVSFTGCKNRKERSVKQDTAIVTAKRDSVRKLSIIFGGDVMQHMPQITAAYRDSGYNYESSFIYLKPVFDGADLVIVNLEGTLSEKGPYSGYPRFRAPAELAKALKNSGVDVVMLANNHICDKGKNGLVSTVSAINVAELLYTGAFPDSISYKDRNPLHLTVNGFRLAILNYTYGTNGLPVPQGATVNLMDTVAMARDFQKLNRDGIDYIITFLHWGNEYSRKPDRTQRELAVWCRGKGANIVIGSHPHVIQPIETIRDTTGNIESITAYSLGNLVSNQRWRYSSGGLLLKTEITCTNDSVNKINASYIPVWVYKHYRDGYREFAILTVSAADTILQGDPAAKERYNEFINDTRDLLSSEKWIKENMAKGGGENDSGNQ